MKCRYCRAPREPDDSHYAKCPVVALLDPCYVPPVERQRAGNANRRRQRATGQSGDGVGWRKVFRKKAKR